MKAIPDNPPGSHAWCGDCDWKNETEKCEALARAHGDSFQHIVHVFEPEPEGAS
ncbi:hypothetical protein SEA_ROBSFEET_16 [Microbacterium phage RobsFeet]|uniref:Uncharacterized protein n=1 Tax=Microbacterium phage RobsFeet TaxID=2201442 RepID=A0A2Z4Q918_9CAUD|nr:hypothetical protein HOT43_gp16 [Microbacterium phage RobsFeet]AWY06023.1 hypothetical protein SEA_ROBSFEET_16 [Microbacterium phage RobsFeet]